MSKCDSAAIALVFRYQQPELVLEFAIESPYDGVGNITTLIDANGQVTRYLYDERDSLQEVWESPSAWTNPASTPSPKYVTAYEVACPDEGGDHLGNLTRVKRDSGGSAERVVDYTYDGLNRVRAETQYPSWPSTSGTLVMQTTYDANGNRATVVDQFSCTTTYSQDRLNRLTIIDGTSAAGLIVVAPSTTVVRRRGQPGAATLGVAPAA